MRRDFLCDCPSWLVRSTGVILLAAGFCLAAGVRAEAGTAYTWLPTGAGTYYWADPGNWDLNASYPHEVDDVANLTADVVTSQTISLNNVDIVLGTLNIGDSVDSHDRYLVKADGAWWTFRVSSGNAAINKGPNGMDDTLQSRLFLYNDLDVTNSASGSDRALVLDGTIYNVSGSPRVVTNTASSGYLTLAGGGNNEIDTLVVAGGVVRLAKSGGNAARDVIVHAGATLGMGGSGGDQINDGATVTVDGDWDINGCSESISRLLGTTGSIKSFDGANATLTVGANDGSSSYSGGIHQTGRSTDGTLGITKIGNGTFTLGGTANTYNGTTAVNGGVLEFASIADVGTACSLGTPADANTTIELGPGTLRYIGTTDASSNRPISLTGDGTVDNQGGGWLIFNNGSGNTVSGADTNLSLTGSSSSLSRIYNPIALGAGRLTVTGGTWFLHGTQDYSGGIFADGGNAVLGAPNIVPDSATVTVTAGGTFDLNGENEGIDRLEGDLTGSVASSGSVGQMATLTVGLGGGSSTFAGAITDRPDNTSYTALTKAGSGVLVLTGTNTYTGVTTVQAGILQMSESSYSNVATNGGGADIQGGKGVLDYSLSGVSPAPEVQALLTASYNDGAWDVGQIRNTTTGITGLTLGWTDNTTASQVTIMATYAGDADLSGTTNVADLTLLLNNYNKTGMVWANGDFNYDGTVNVADLTALLNNYNKSVGGSVAAGLSMGGSAVPEPGTIPLLSTGLLGLLAYAWRKWR
jgi:fibronectin-binding autotransporter adhesin